MLDAKRYQTPPVDSEEMAFAIALFLSAAKGRIAPPNTNPAGFSFLDGDALERDPLLLGATAILQEGPASLPDDVPLACAVSVLWHHYDQDVRQQAICSRLVAFYARTVRGRGEPLTAGSKESDPRAVPVSPAIVRAVATATVGGDGHFDDAEFESLVERFTTHDDALAGSSASPDRKQPAAGRSTARLPVTEEVQRLSLQLFAFQSCVAADPTQPTPHFRALEQLCVRVADISGSAALQAMLSRAWRATLSDFPWLHSVPPLNARLLTGLDKIQPAPTVQEAMKCEMALLGSLIELLRSLLGDGVTIQLLRSLWPLASLELDGRTASHFLDFRMHDGLVRQTGPTQ
jgi:hypothetical protein